MKILLVYPLIREFMAPSMPPLGLAYIAASLKEAGHEIKVVDLNGDRENGLLYLKNLISGGSFGMIGISSIITQYKRVKELGKLIKSIVPHTPLVLGGPGPTSIPELYLKNCNADIVCMGEGEETTKEIVDYIQNKMPLESCTGIIFKRQDGSYVNTGKRSQIRDINTIKFPAWEMFYTIKVYVENYLFKQGRDKGMSILSTRGCPGECNYCMCNFGRMLRMRTVENIFSEIETLVRNYNIEHIHFIDDTFITTSKRIKEISNFFKNEFRSLTWSANVRVNFVKPDVLKIMADSNCVSLAYGIESGSPAVLKYMKKGFTTEQASNAIKWTREAGILLTTYFMIGMPCETYETVRETIDFCKENLVGGEFFFVTPIPGAELYEYAKENKIINDEDVYMEHVGEVRDFLVNLTNMSNEELFAIKENAELEIKEHLGRHNITVKQSVRKNPRELVHSLPKF